jgi:Flp pilus assembly protein TadD
VKRLLERLYGRARGHSQERNASAPGPATAADLQQRVTTLQASGRHDEAIAVLQAAARATPDDRMVHGTLAIALFGQQRLEDAESAMRAALAIDPRWSAGRNLLGVILQNQRRVVEARGAFAEAAACDPTSVDALTNVANADYDAGDLDAALRHVEQGLALRPDSAALLLTKGRTLLRAGRIEDAATALRLALAFDPHNAAAMNDLGAIAQSQGDDAGAAKCFEAAARLAPDLVEPRTNLASLLLERGDVAAAEGYISEVLAIRQDHVEALNLRTLVHKARDEHDIALATVRGALVRHPGNASLNITLGTLLAERCEFAAAEVAYRAALAADPSLPEAQYVVGTSCLRRGDYEEGFRRFDARFAVFRKGYAGSRNLIDRLGGQRLWRGEPIAGKRIAVWSEQGFGDCLMMSRYLPLLQAQGASLIVVTYEGLLRLTRTLPGIDDVRLDFESLLSEPFDFHCGMLSLPAAMKTRRDAVPPPAPFAIPQHSVDAWSARFGDDRRPRIGLVWSGSKDLRDDRLRNVPFASLASLAEHPAYRFVSLQKDGVPREPAAGTAALDDWMPDCRDFLDTAALVRTLDLVITVDTAVAHLAGSLGVPTWLLNRYGSEWRWGIGETASPWYPSMRIFNQDTRGDWSSTLDAVRAALDARPASRRGSVSAASRA